MPCRCRQSTPVHSTHDAVVYIVVIEYVQKREQPTQVQVKVSSEKKKIETLSTRTLQQTETHRATFPHIKY